MEGLQDSLRGLAVLAEFFADVDVLSRIIIEQRSGSLRIVQSRCAIVVNDPQIPPVIIAVIEAGNAAE